MNRRLLDPDAAIRAAQMAQTIADFRPKDLVLLDPHIVAAAGDCELAGIVADAIRRANDQLIDSAKMHGPVSALPDATGAV